VPNALFGSHVLLILLFNYYLTIPFFTNSGRYSDFAKKLNANGFKVYGMDWIGKFESDFTCLFGFITLDKTIISSCLLEIAILRC
jgi:hypothetical protein